MINLHNIFIKHQDTALTIFSILLCLIHLFIHKMIEFILFIISNVAIQLIVIIENK